MITATPRLFLEVSALMAIASVCAVLILIGRPVDTILPMISLLAICSVRFILTVVYGETILLKHMVIYTKTILLHLKINKLFLL